MRRKRPIEHGGRPRTELERRPIVLERAKGDDDRAGYRFQPPLDHRGDVASGLRENHGEHADEGISLGREQQQVGILERREPDDVLGGRRRRERCHTHGDAACTEVASSLVERPRRRRRSPRAARSARV